jgi:hypothetical protein
VTVENSPPTDTRRGLRSEFVNRGVRLPHGLAVPQVEEAVKETYRLFDGINDYLVKNGFMRLEDLVLGNSLSGLISEFVVKNLALASKTLIANKKVGGYPDLLPKAKYPTGSVLKGSDGIEVKTSIRPGGWQGHNPERCWVMIFRYTIGKQKDGETLPLTFTEILCARLVESDWSFSGRNQGSRRTPTASITEVGVEKLRSNFVYRAPGVGVGRHKAVLASGDGLLPGLS